MKMKLESEVYSVAATVTDERNDCGVRALMVAACIDYATAHDCCRLSGRKFRDGMFNYQMSAAIKRAGFIACAQDYAPAKVREYFRAPRWDRQYISNGDGPQRVRRYVYPTIAEFAARHPRGHFILQVLGHYVALCDGVVHDWKMRTARARREVRAFWQLV